MASLQKVPRYSKCFVCGKDNSRGLNLFFYREDNMVCADFTGTLKDVGYGDRVHGGILASLIDEAMGWAPHFITGRMYYTWELNIRYLEPLPVELPVKVLAYMKEDKKRYVISAGKILDKHGKIYIKASGKYAPMSEKNQEEVMTYLACD